MGAVASTEEGAAAPVPPTPADAKTRHDFRKCVLGTACIRSNPQYCDQLFKGSLPPPLLVTQNVVAWEDTKFQPLRSLGGGKSGALLMLGTIPKPPPAILERQPAVLKIWLNAFSPLDSTSEGDERPFRELYTQCVLNGVPGFNCLGCFGVAPYPSQWIGPYHLDPATGAYVPREGGIFFDQLQLPTWHPTRVLFMITSVTPGAPLMQLQVGQQPQALLRGMVLSLTAAWQRAQDRLGVAFAHNDMHAENIFVARNEQKDQPVVVPNTGKVLLQFPDVNLIDFDLATSDRFPAPVENSVPALGIRERTIQWLMKWLPLESVLQLLALYALLNRLGQAGGASSSSTGNPAAVPRINRDFWHLLSYATVAEAYRDGPEHRTPQALQHFLADRVGGFVAAARQIMTHTAQYLLAEVSSPHPVGVVPPGTRSATAAGTATTRVAEQVSAQLKASLARNATSARSAAATILSQTISMFVEFLHAMGYVEESTISVRDTAPGGATATIDLSSRPGGPGWQNMSSEGVPAVTLLAETTATLLPATLNALGEGQPDAAVAAAAAASTHPQTLNALFAAVNPFANASRLVSDETFDSWLKALTREFQTRTHAFQRQTGHFPAFDNWVIRLGTPDTPPPPGVTRSDTTPSGIARSDTTPPGIARSDTTPPGVTRLAAIPPGVARSDTTPPATRRQRALVVLLQHATRREAALRLIVPPVESASVTVAFHQLVPTVALVAPVTFMVSAPDLRSLAGAFTGDFFAKVSRVLTDILLPEQDEGEEWGEEGQETPYELLPPRVEVVPWVRDPTLTYLAARLLTLSVTFGNPAVVTAAVDITEIVAALPLATGVQTWVLQKLLKAQTTGVLRLALVNPPKTRTYRLELHFTMEQAEPHSCIQLATKLAAGIPYVPAFLGCHTFLVDLIRKANPGYFSSAATTTAPSVTTTPAPPSVIPPPTPAAAASPTLGAQVVNLLPQSFLLSLLFIGRDLDRRAVQEQVKLAEINRNGVLLLPHYIAPAPATTTTTTLAAGPQIPSQWTSRVPSSSEPGTPLPPRRQPVTPAAEPPGETEPAEAPGKAPPAEEAPLPAPPAAWRTEAPVGDADLDRRVEYIQQWRRAHPDRPSGFPPGVLITPSIWRRLQEEPTTSASPTIHVGPKGGRYVILPTGAKRYV